MSTCDVCNNNASIGVASIPGIPMSVAYCRPCLEANAHPYWAVVANTACVGGYEESADWWKGLVQDTLRYLGKTLQEFDADVSAAIAEEQRYWDSLGV